MLENLPPARGGNEGEAISKSMRYGKKIMEKPNAIPPSPRGEGTKVRRN